MAQWDSFGFETALKYLQGSVTVLQSTSISEEPDCKRYRINEKASSRWLDAWSQYPHANIITIPDAGHYTMLKQPDLVTEAIRAAYTRRQSQLLAQLYDPGL